MAELDKRTQPIDLLPEPRRDILRVLKKSGWATVPKLAEELSVSTEAVRQQLWHLEEQHLVKSNCGPEEAQQDDVRLRGRPAVEYCLSPGGEDLFPKKYAEAALIFFDLLDDEVQALRALTDERVQNFESALSGASLSERVKALRSIYIADDPYTTVEKSDRGYRIVETNCPYLSFAMERPLFCSTTVSTLRRLTGCEVVREKRFQDGDGKCVFHVLADRPLSQRRIGVRFEKEPEI